MLRQYSPRLGRFLAADLLHGEIDNPGSLNRYVYVLNDPVNLIDPSGLDHVSYVFRDGCFYKDTYEMRSWTDEDGTIHTDLHLVSSEEVFCERSPQDAGRRDAAANGGGTGATIAPQTNYDSLNAYCNARGRAKFIADWVPGSAGLVQNLWGSSFGDKLGVEQLPQADLDRILDENSWASTVGFHGGSEALKETAGSSTFLHTLRAKTGVPKTLASKWLGRVSGVLIAIDAGKGFYHEGEEILNCQAGY
jgi:uncharacterized protein RhaS with RHS repeats